ncbi:integrase [Paractinoplanes abujensis]|uniref:Xaa-Pro aminopeptidase n=1 Tax=Paractinoplanes abujensis TaxID=882441 RepID=A0A7W7CMG8_9ACTN|nr:Xaa-Pro peptidase family protein [Actinoplanes abujensis]MBB4691274.1 Xaa-Pro aminopeptidase [Actinoplanes abujensis]GID17311.1 integrase [Actinoplanes abujensis]
MSGDLAAQRLARLRAGLAGAPFDALVLTEPESILYATGYRSLPGQVFRTHRMAAVVTGDDLWLICTAADAPAAAASGLPVDRLVPFGRFYVEGPDAELTGMADRHADLDSALETALGRLPPGTRVVREAETDVAAQARMIKLPGEVELLRYAARLCEEAVHKALVAAGPGTTERELAAVIAATMAEGGADPRFIVAAVGERSALADVVPGDRAWQVGETARFDVGCVVDGYWSDIGRTAVLGEPDARQQQVYAAVHAGEQAQLDAARPGVTAEELFRLGLEGTGARVPRYRRQHCGHGIGLSIYEPPIIAPGGATPLRAGMTFCFETPYYELGWGGMMIEDTVMITEDGYEMLCSGERDLLVVPA